MLEIRVYLVPQIIHPACLKVAIRLLLIVFQYLLDSSLMEDHISLRILTALKQNVSAYLCLPFI